MATATYSDYTVLYPGSKAARGTVEAWLDAVASEIASRCLDCGTDYASVAGERGGLLKRIECTAVYRICGRSEVGGVDQNGLSSFSQSVGDHRVEFGYQSGGGKNLLLDDECKLLGLSGQAIGWLGIPGGGDASR